MDELPQGLLRSLNMPAESDITGLPGNENENYLITYAEKSYVVKKLRGQTAANTETEAQYRAHLHQQGLPVTPYAMLSENAHVLTIGNKDFVATPFLKGQTAMPEPVSVADAAKQLARVHLLDAAGLPARVSWYRKHYVTESLRHIDNAYAPAKLAFARQAAEMPDFWDGRLPAGIIHGDLQRDNIVVDEENKVISVLDWEECSVEPLLLDVAHAAQQFSFVNGVSNRDLFYVFMEAYQAVRPLTTHEHNLFNDAFRYGMLALSVWSHIKMTRHEVNDELFDRVGNYYRATYDIPSL